ncbi:MAG: hypothetical protein Fur0046_31390 [Cyanobacteria bacterium J069]
MIDLPPDSPDLFPDDQSTPGGTDAPQSAPQLVSQPVSQSEADQAIAALLLSLRRKQGTWIDWGKACLTLQKAGYSPQQIFEATGFEPIQQNQIVVAAQVYLSMLKVGVSDAVRSRFEKTGSDTLYEFRVLGQGDRAAVAELVVQKGIDSEGARDVVRAVKEYSRLAAPPEQFPNAPGDAVAYYCWNVARQQADLQARSRLIAQGLRFASSDSARQQLERLLTDFGVARVQQAPRLPFYRLETESEVPRVIPVAGRLPLSRAHLQAVPILQEEEPFGIVKFSGTGAWVPVPGWQVILASEDPVALMTDSDQLPNAPEGDAEVVLVILDRAQRQWDEFSYFVVDQDGQLDIQWFDQPPAKLILGRVVLIMRPKRVLDEGFNKELWQLEE